MEYLEGETLLDRLAKGPLPLEQTLRYGVEIADALDKAHRQGIVHRDLKPGNVMLTKSGVKLLDFGLAKAMAPAAQPSGLTALPTQQALTQEGTILGTFQYMAPEQLEGKEADGRTDIFALGAVMYEMATGSKAFSASSQASLITAIMSADPPPISTVQPMSPPALDRVVKKCLAKDPEGRWQTAADLGSELKWIGESGSQAGLAAPVASRRRRREGLARAIAALLGAVAALGVVLLVRKGMSPGTAAVHAVILLPESAGFQTVAVPELSPDGRTVAFSGVSTDEASPIWLRALGSDDARPIPGTEGASFAFWSPDGRSLGFFADRKLKRIDVAGGSATTVCDVPDEGRGGTWSQDGTIVFAGGRSTGLSRIASTGGTPEPVTKPDPARGDSSHRWPRFLPDGRHLVYFATPNTGRQSALFYASSDGKENRLLVEGASNGAYSQGHLLFVQRSTLFAQPFDPGKGRLQGKPIALADGVGSGFGVTRAMFSASADGTLVSVRKPPARRSTLEWLDRAGKRLGNLGQPMEFYDAVLSPDGKKLAVGIGDTRTDQGNLWVLDLSRGTRTRLTFGPTSAWGPVWSPDSTRLAYLREGEAGKAPVLYTKAASGAGAEEQVVAMDAIGEIGDLWVSDWSPDGSSLALSIFRTTTGTNYGIWSLGLTGDHKPRPLIDARADESHPRFSPDGKWIAYDSNESGRGEVYVQAFPGPGGKFQVSTGGGSLPQWRRDGGELLFLSAENHLMAVPIQTNPTFDAGTPHELFPERLEAGEFEASPDGQRFLVRFPLPETATKSVRLVLNWPAELKK